MLHIGASSVREYAPVLRGCVRTIPAGEEHHIDSVECSRERRVVVEAALHNLDAAEPRGAGGVPY
jgi:hypothetical protein